MFDLGGDPPFLQCCPTVFPRLPPQLCNGVEQGTGRSFGKRFPPSPILFWVLPMGAQAAPGAGSLGCAQGRTMLARFGCFGCQGRRRSVFPPAAPSSRGNGSARWLQEQLLAPPDASSLASSPPSCRPGTLLPRTPSRHGAGAASRLPVQLQLLPSCSGVCAWEKPQTHQRDIEPQHCKAWAPSPWDGALRKPLLRASVSPLGQAVIRFRFTAS